MKQIDTNYQSIEKIRYTENILWYDQWCLNQWNKQSINIINLLDRIDRYSENIPWYDRRGPEGWEPRVHTAHIWTYEDMNDASRGTAKERQKAGR